MNQPGTENSKNQLAGKYGNFRDPVGLLKRMLLSGNRAAYDALLRAGLAIGVTPIDLLLQSRERRHLSEVSLDKPTHPQLLIVGPPRSGSTLLYQTLARYADVSYLSNLSDLFPRSPIAATSLLQRRRKLGGKNFSNYYGQTAGLRAPNDGFAVWNRWAGTRSLSHARRAVTRHRRQHAQIFCCLVDPVRKAFPEQEQPQRLLPEVACGHTDRIEVRHHSP